MKWYWSKYPTWVKVLVIFAVVIGIGMALWDGFKGSQKVGTSFQTKKPLSHDNRKVNTETASKELKVKGFSLGMSIDDAAELLNTKYADITRKQSEDGTLKEGVSVKQSEDGTFIIGIVISPEGSMNAFMSMATGGLTGTPYEIEIKAGSDKKVNSIFFRGNITDLLFNSKDMDFKSFSEEFAKTYGILQFEYFIKEETSAMEGLVYRKGYRYSSDDGYYVQIMEKKDLLIKAIPKSKERSFD